MSLLLSYKDADIYQSDLDLFANGNWLNDSCINYSFKKIEDKLSTGIGTILMDPCLVSFMILQATDDEENAELAKSLDVANKTWIIVPINDNSSFDKPSTHWSLLLCHIPTGLMYSFDSHRNYNELSTRKTAERLTKLIGRRFHTLRSVSTPQQTNGSDCGVYLVLIAQSIVKFIAEERDSAENDIIGESCNCERLQHVLAREVCPEQATEFRRQSAIQILAEAANYHR